VDTHEQPGVIDTGGNGVAKSRPEVQRPLLPVAHASKRLYKRLRTPIACRLQELRLLGRLPASVVNHAVEAVSTCPLTKSEITARRGIRKMQPAGVDGHYDD